MSDAAAVSAAAVVTNIQGFSLHDGPGIRTVVFCKGCPLRCRWCANPECIAPEPQIGFLRHLCAHCGRCRAVCPYNALQSHSEAAEAPNRVADSHRVDYSRCRACGACVAACGYGALVRYGASMTVPEVWDAVRRDRAFYDSSSGGVTVSGGEPLLRPAFVRQLFELCQNDGIDTCMETCGFAAPAAVREILPVTRHFLFDLKHLDARTHKEYTGQSNQLILENAALLLENGADVLFRQPLLPGLNDRADNIAATARFLRASGASASQGPRLELMPYHCLGQAKYQALGLPYAPGVALPDATAAAEAARAAYLAHGIQCVISR